MRHPFELDDDYSEPYPDSERLTIVDDVALAACEVWSGADAADASALLNALEDRGLLVVRDD